MQARMNLLFPGKHPEVPQGGAVYVFALKQRSAYLKRRTDPALAPCSSGAARSQNMTVRNFGEKTRNDYDKKGVTFRRGYLCCLNAPISSSYSSIGFACAYTCGPIIVFLGYRAARSMMQKGASC